MNKLLNYNTPFGLYIHIPFCESKCNYCDFYSIKNKKEKVNKFIDALAQEIELYSNSIDNNELKTIYIGGGTPSILSPAQIEWLLDKIYEKFEPHGNIEITMEANPESLNSEKIKKYRKANINRLSLGVQSFLDKELNFLGRLHDSKKSLEVIREVKMHFSNFSFDIIFALPGQSLDDFKYSLRKAIELNPPHLSLYNLQIEEGTPLNKKLEAGEIKPITEELDYKMYNFAISKLKNSGYKQYEISNFAKEEYESQHNLLYWRYKPYLGLGPSAHGFNNKKRYYNIRDLNDYINLLKNGEYPIKEIIELNKEDLMSEMMFMGLRLIKGVDKKDFYNRFDLQLKDVYKDVINKLKKDNLITETEDRIYLTKRGINLGNVSFAEFLL